MTDWDQHYLDAGNYYQPTDIAPKSKLAEASLTVAYVLAALAVGAIAAVAVMTFL